MTYYRLAKRPRTLLQQIGFERLMWLTTLALWCYASYLVGKATAPPPRVERLIPPPAACPSKSPGYFDIYTT